MPGIPARADCTPQVTQHGPHVDPVNHCCGCLYKPVPQLPLLLHCLAAVGSLLIILKAKLRNTMTWET